MAARIDGLLSDAWQEAEVQPAGPADDAEFCRRVWFDFAGVAPPVSVVRAFLTDPAPDKRDRMVRRLLHSRRFDHHLSERFSELLVPADDPAQALDTRPLQVWLEERFRRDTPYDHVVADLLVASGPVDQGPAVFFASRESEPTRVATATSQIFLGLQLQCAQCHDHPFDDWKQEDFWNFAAFFGQLRQRAVGNRQWVEDDRNQQLRTTEGTLVSTPMYPGVSQPPEPDPAGLRRRQLTIWLASRDNPYLARAAVNRAWQHLFGRGLVEPVDAMDAYQHSRHSQLLDELAEYFVDQRFDLRALYATLAATDAYRRSSVYRGADRPGAEWFAVMAVKTLTPAQYFDTLVQNVWMSGPADTGPADTGPTDPRTSIRGRFLTRMRMRSATPTEYPHGVLQALATMNGPELQRATMSTDVGVLATMKTPLFSDEDQLDVLYLATLSRFPSDQERRRCEAFLNEQAGDNEEAALAIRNEHFADLLWALLCSTECAMCP